MRVFLEGAFFWIGASAGVAYLPSLAGACGLTDMEKSAFFAGAAIGRTLFQPVAGQLVDPARAYAFRLASLAILIGAALVVSLGNSPILLVIARLAEGTGLSIFVVSWRTILNELRDQPIFDSVNDAYVTSQSTGRLAGPAIAALLASAYGPRGVFAGSALAYAMCLLFRSRHMQEERALPQFQREPRLSWRSCFTVPIGVHVLEFISLGLWLVVWPVFLGSVAGVGYGALGLFFSISACGGLFWPLIRRFALHLPVSTRMRSGLLTLALTSFVPAVGLTAVPALMMLAILSGIGSTAYFTSFHRYISDTFSVHEIPKIYGFLGTITFLAQAVGQAIAPALLRRISPSTALLLNSVILIVAVVLLSISQAGMRRSYEKHV